MTKLSILSTCLLAGCGTLSATPQWDARFGDATRTAFAQQVLHPDAARLHATVDGGDGPAAAAAQQRYRKSFAEPTPPQGVLTIGLGGTK